VAVVVAIARVATISALNLTYFEPEGASFMRSSRLEKTSTGDPKAG
jgi:hypothetical protein